jgi:hypothetical protein
MSSTLASAESAAAPASRSRRRTWLFAAALVIFIVIAARIYWSGRDAVIANHGASLAGALEGREFELGLGVSAALKPGMLLRKDRFDVVSDLSDTFQRPQELHDLHREGWPESGEYEDDVAAGAEGEADLLSAFGWSGSKARLESGYSRHIVTTVNDVAVDELTESDIDDALLTTGALNRLTTDKSVVMVQAVMTARSCSITYRDEKTNSAGINGGSDAPSASSHSKELDSRAEKSTNCVIGFKTWVILPSPATPEAAHDLVAGLKDKGYDAKLNGKLLFVQANRRLAPSITEAAKKMTAPAVMTPKHETPEEATARRAAAMKALPAKPKAMWPGAVKFKTQPM